MRKSASDGVAYFCFFFGVTVVLFFIFVCWIEGIGVTV